MNRMSDLATKRARTDIPRQLMEATVADPALAGRWLRVIVDAQPGRVRECPWAPRADADPQPGDHAVVQESDHGTLWALLWWPQTDPGPGSGS